MNLAYKILWFEDDLNWYNSIIEDVREVIEDEFGFYFTPPKREINDSNFSTIRFEDFDLILMDYKLQNDPKGDAIIERLRVHEVYTDVIFYSSSGEAFVRERMKEKGVDGVYCVSRDAIPFITKVRKIIQTTIKKVQDINNMRGLVMAEVSDFDEKMLQIIKKHLSNIGEESCETFLMSRKDKLIKSLEEKREKVLKLENDKLIYDWNFESSHKWRTVKEIANFLHDDKISECIETYETEVSQKRNRLAHVKEVFDELGNISLVDKDFIFNDETCKQIRSDLKKHSTNFDRINLKLSQ